MSIVNFFKLIWLRIQQRGTLYASKNEQFDKLYQVSDPWRMGSELEQFRFQETNRIIEQELGAVVTLLEIGCGEGHQTEHLDRLCGQLYGFDVSKTAVGRARQRCPAARLSVADIFSYPPELKKFDLVVACEVLYYIKDVPAALERMSELGSHCLVTYFQSGPCVLDAFFNNIEGAETRVIKVGDTSWKIVWWSDRGGCLS
jgi:SAM-dependent methyltransferase